MNIIVCMPHKDPEEKRQYERRYLSIPENRKKKQKRDLAYYYRNKEKKLRYQREYRMKNKEMMKVHRKRWYDNHKKERADYRKSHRKQLRAEEQGRSIPLSDSCLLCGSKENLIRHHPDYDEPLQIVTVCRVCHAHVHGLYVN